MLIQGPWVWFVVVERYRQQPGRTLAFPPITTPLLVFPCRFPSINCSGRRFSRMLYKWL